MLQKLNWPSLEIRRTRVRLIMFYKIIHHVVAIHPLDTLLLPTTTITRYNTSHTYKHIRTDKDSYKYSFYPRFSGIYCQFIYTKLPQSMPLRLLFQRLFSLLFTTLKRSPYVYSSTLALNNEHSLYIITSTIVQTHCTP